MIRIKRVMFRKSVELVRDLDRTGFSQGQLLRSPLWQGDVPVHIDLHPGFVSLLAEGVDGSNKPVVVARMYPTENVDYIEVDPGDLKATLDRQNKR